VHELSLADAVVTIARDHARGRRVTRVDVKIGRLRQVVPDALEFAFELVAAGTEVEGAELRVEHVPARVRCARCAVESDADEFPLACARCGSVDVDVVAGEELLVESLELEEEGIPVGGSGGAACGADHQDARALPVRPSELTRRHAGVAGGR
jgi:hydrogenase nickel incorporation protein HypA/HybF